MKYMPDVGDVLLWVPGFTPPRYVKPDEVWPDILLGTVLLVLLVAVFVYWFGAKIRRATKGK